MATKPLSNLKAYLTLLGGLSFMCFSAVIIKSAHAPGIVTAFYRMSIGAIVLTIPFLASVINSPKSLNKKGILIAILAGICFGFDMSLWSTAVVASNATLPTLFANLAPVWVGVGSMIIFREKHKPLFWIGLFIAIAGIFILISKDLNTKNGILFGALLGLGAGIFYGIFYLLSQSGRKLLETLPYLYVSTLTSSLVLLIMMLLFNYSFTGYDTKTWVLFLAIGIGVQVIGWYLINNAQGFLPASVVAPTLLGQPVITAILAVVLLNEKLTPLHWIGGSIVVSGIYLVHFSKKRKKGE